MSTDAVPMSQWPSDQRFVIPVAPGPDMVTLTIDGQEVQAPRGELLIKVAQNHGSYIPRFCWHERMKPVGMCRMCLVEVEGMRGMQISCATPVSDGMVVNTQSPNVKAVQDGVLEFLLINHPLDCPVCDRGGECPLQDQTLAFGPGESRFVEEKRHFEKPVPISDLVLLDRERCIQCGRCTRFAAEIAGDPMIDFGERGGNTQVITYPHEPFSSYFSGNTVQICPVGALTASAYRFRARPWDLQTVETSCQTCSVGCRGALQSTSNRIVRFLGVDSEAVNQGWLCDKGRYGYEWVHSAERVRAPMVRKHGEMVEVSWPEALDAAAAGLRDALDTKGPSSIALLGGARGTNEDAYVWARFAKSVLGTDNVDAQLGDGLPAEVVLGLPGATIADLDHARAVVLVAPDLREELPVLHLRVRRAAVELGVPVIEIAPRATGLTRDVTAVLRHAPGEAGAMAEQFARALAGDGTASGSGSIEKAVSALDGRDGDVVVVLGRQSLAESPESVVQAAAALAAVPGVKFLSALRRGNVRGALDLGLTPGFLPGRVTLDAGRDHFTGAWGRVPAERGLDAAGVLEAAAAGTVDTLVLLGSDLVEDFPDRIRMRAGLDALRFVVAVGAFPGDAADTADVFLPTSVWGEKTGSTTNLEGRVMRQARLITPEGTTMADWRIAQELAARFDAEFGLETVEDVQDEIARVAPAHAGVDAEMIRRARDGAVLPVADFPGEIVLHAPEGSKADAPFGTGSSVSWEPIRPGTVAADSPPAHEGALEDAAAGEEEEVAAETAPPTVELPALHVWDRVASTPAATPPDAYSLRLVAARTLYDAGRIVSSSPSLAALAGGVALVVHPSDLERIGVSAEGDAVLVTSSRGTVRLAVLADAATAPGTAFMAFAQKGDVGPNDLVDITAPLTELRVETTR
jgi:NADH-quinone oxidoreductase subunit G